MVVFLPMRVGTRFLRKGCNMATYEGRSNWVGFFLVLPALLVLLILYVYPLILSIYSSFVHNGVVGLANYGKAFDLYGKDIFYTLFVTVVTVAFVFGVSIGVASYLRFKEWKFLDYMYRLPLFIPFLIVGHAMRVFLARHGLLNMIISKLTGIQNLPGLATDWVGLMLAFAWVLSPFAILIVLGAFKAIDDSYIEAALNLGSSKIKVVWDILIPLARPSIIVAFVLTFIRTISSLTIPLMVGPPKPTMLPVDMMFRINYYNDWGVANALGVVSYLIVIGFAMYYLRFMMVERGGLKH